MERRNFVKGAAAGVLVSTGVIGGVKALSGDFDVFTTPLLMGPAKQLAKPYGDLKVILLGTGNPISSNYRSKPAQVVLAGNKAFLVDCGAGAVERLIEVGICPESIDDVFITHHHSDHNSGFIDLFISRIVGGALPGKMIPLNLYGPTNSQAIMGKIIDHLQWDIFLRVTQTADSAEGAKLAIFEKDEGVVYDQDGVKVTTFLVDHGIVKPAVGYKFQYQGKSVVISGDTRPNDNLLEYAQGSDILIHEAYSQKWLDIGVAKFPDKAAKAEGIKQYHSSVFEAAEIAQKAGVKQLVFSHLMPSPAPFWVFEKHWASGASDIFNGSITVGRDLKMIT